MIQLKVKGMNCAGCASKIEANLALLPGVEWATVNYATSKAVISASAQEVDVEKAQQTIEKLGYRWEPLSDRKKGELEKQRRERRQEMQSLQLRFVISLGLSLAVMAIAMLAPWSESLKWLLEGLLVTPVWIWAGWPFLKGMIKSFGSAPFSMDTLIGLGTSVAYIYSAFIVISGYRFSGVKTFVYFEGVGFIITFILLGKVLEGRAKNQTTEAMEALLDLSQDFARKVSEGQERMLEIEEIKPGDQIRVKPGEVIPLDGIVVEGESTADESIISGESLPIVKQKDVEVVGGSMNLSGSLLVQVTHAADSGFLSRVTQMVEDAQNRKAPIQKLADRISQIFVPIVIVISLVSFVSWWFWGPEPVLGHALMAMVAVLIISCPCALGLATPTAVMVGVGAGSQRGILIRDGEALEAAHEITDIVLDKTGTITEGRFSVVNEDGFTGLEAEGDKRRILALENLSEHPIAVAIVSHLQKDGWVAKESVEKFESTAGEGVSAIVSSERVFIGNFDFIQRQLHSNEKIPPTPLNWLKEVESTVVFVAKEGRYIGAFALSDTVRSQSPVAIRQLQEMGLRVWMVTGDQENAAKKVAETVGLPLERVRASVKPDGKLQFIEERKQKGFVVAMVGDGVNDAPALAAANVSIAMGMGTDVALSSSQVGLASNDLTGVVDAMKLSKVTMKVIRQNLFFSFLYNSLGIPLAAGLFFPLLGWQLSPIFASMAMALSSVSVVVNSLRLKRWQNISV